MQLSYTLTPAHWSSYVTAVQRRTRRAARGPGYLSILAWLALAIVFVVAGPWLAARGFGAEHGLAFSLGAFGAWVLLTIYLLRWQRHSTRRGLREDGIVLGPKTLALNADGLIVRGTAFEQRYGWASIEGVETRKDIVIVWFEPIVGTFVPVEAFGGADRVGAFNQAIERGLGHKAG